MVLKTQIDEDVRCGGRSGEWELSTVRAVGQG